jgi:uncharacterized protein with von Willebrand factor type A (vWA) domain
VIEKVLEFAAILRRNGLRVSTAEVLDAAQALGVTGLGDPGLVRAALRATLVKRSADLEPFEDLFDLFFFRAGDFAGGARQTPLGEALARRGLTEDEIEAVLALLADEATRMSQLGRMGLGLGRGQLERLIRLAGLEIDLGPMSNPLQIGFYTMRLLESMGMSRAEHEIDGLRGPLGRKLSPDRAAEVMAALGEIMGTLRRAAREYVHTEFEKRNRDFYQQFRSQQLFDKPFGAMTDADLAALEQEIRRLARRLRSQATLRPRIERRGRLDVRRTLRESLSAGGVPFRLRWRRRRPEKPRIVVLCDISDSVRHVSRFMLQLTYLVQDLFSKVRSFVFVADIGETTGLFREHELHRAVELAYGGAIINVYANSNYGRAFWQFTQQSLDAVTSRTTVIVIGDGRNNYNPSHAACLGDVRRRARRVLWLNPEPPANWAFGDSAMRDYAPHCDRVELVFNLKSLSRVVDSLVL